MKWNEKQKLRRDGIPVNLLQADTPQVVLSLVLYKQTAMFVGVELISQHSTLSLHPCLEHLPPATALELPPANEPGPWTLSLHICYSSLSLYPLCYKAEVRLGFFTFWHLCGSC